MDSLRVFDGQIFPFSMPDGTGGAADRYKNMPLELKKSGFLAGRIFKTRGRCSAPADQNRVAIVNGEKILAKEKWRLPN